MHKGAWYDHANGAVNASASSSSSDLNNTNLIAYCQTAFSPSTSWARFADKFIHYSNNSANNDNDYSTITRPQYILASFSTNESAGGGTDNDRLALDNLWCIYDKGLSSVSIGGTANSAALNAFNAAEFATHEPACAYDASGNPIFNNSGSTTFNYPTPVACNNIPQVAAQPKSKLITAFTVTQANADNGYKATIHVVHNDNSTFDYYIQFAVDLPTLTATATPQVVCEGASATLNVTGANTYSWSTGQSGSSITVTPTQQHTTYTVTGTASNGCSNTASVSVEMQPQPTVSISGSTSICAGLATTLTGTGAASYVWSNGSHDSYIQVTTGGSYTVTGSTSYGCTATATVTVTAHDAPTVTIDGPTFLCSGTTATLTASGLSNYTWSGSAQGNDNPLTITSGGTYTVSGTDANGCSGSTTKSVTGKTTPTVTISGTTALCDGATGTLTANVTPANSTLTWNNGSTSSSLDITSADTYTVTASLDGCESSVSVTVTSAASPTAPTANNGSRCGEGTVELSVNNPVDGYTYHWYTQQSGGSEAGNGTTFTTTNLVNPNTYNYYVSAQNEGGCFSPRTQVTATVNAVPANPGVDGMSVCGASDITLTATSANTVKWYSDAAGNNEITAAQHVTGDATFYAAAISSNGCRSALVPLTVTVNEIPAAPVVTTTPASPICSNNSVSVQLNVPQLTGYNVKWYNSEMQYEGQGFQMTRTVNGITTYYATITNSNTQCVSAETPVEIVINPLPTAPSDVTNASVCGSGDITLTNQSTSATNWYSDPNGETEAAVNQHITSNTTFYAAVVDQNNCRSSLVPMTVTVNPVYAQTDDYQTACGSYTWQGETYTTSGDITKTISSSLGCDSTVTLHLTINNGYNVSFDTTVCNAFTWLGETYTTSQTIEKNLQSVSGCDSIVTCHLTVKHSSTSTQTITVCNNEIPFMFAGTEITSAGTQTITLPNANADGCDSIITLTVNVNPTPGTPTLNSTVLSRCGAGTLNLNVSKGSNSDGCRWYATQTGGEPIHTGLSYTPELTESTTFYVSSYSNAGCESDRIEVAVTVNEVPGDPQITTAEDTRCGAGDVILSAAVGENGTQCRWYGNNNPNNTTVLSTESTYTVTFNNNQNTTRTFYVESYNVATGCKSATRVAAVATENAVPAAPQVTDATNCGPLTADLAEYVNTSADLFRWYDSDETQLAENAHYNTTVNESTNFLVSVYNSETTCESPKSTLTVTIRPTYEPQSIHDTICQNVPYQNYGIAQTFTTAGEKSFVLNTVTANGCDSLVTLYVYVKPQVTNTITAEACNEYVWNGETFSESNTYVRTLTAANGCDSVVTLNLTINTAQHQDVYETACDSYEWNGETYTASGDHTMTFTSANSCDSVVTLHLTINSSTSYTDVHDVCNSFTWIDGNTYTESNNTATFTMPNAAGCDSVITLNLTVRKATAYTDVHDVCDSYTWIDGTTYTESNHTATYTTTNAAGCDSVITLDLTVRKATAFTDVQEACSSYTWIDGITYTESNHTATFTTTNAAGCDSVVTLDLSIHQPVVKNLTDTVCQGTPYNRHGFQLATDVPGTYTETHNLTTVFGCDSTVTLELTVNPAHQVQLADTICIGEPYTENGFNIPAATQPGTFPHTLSLQNAYGCDSTVMLSLTVAPTQYIVLNDMVCAGEHYTNYGFDTTLRVAGTYTLTHNDLTVFGCDSTTTLSLVVTPTYQTHRYDTLCFNGSIFFNGQTLTAPGIYRDTLPSVHGCDSIVILHLSVRPEKRRDIVAHICNGSDYTENGFNITGATETDDYENNNLDVNGCDSTTTLHLFVHDPVITELSDTVCQGTAYNRYGFQFDADEAGIVTLTQELETSFHCDSIVILTLTVNPSHDLTYDVDGCVNEPVSAYGFDTTFNKAGHYTLVHQGLNVYDCDSVTTLNVHIYAKPQTYLNATICYNDEYDFHGVMLTEEGLYTDTLTSAHGCDSIVRLYLTQYPEKSRSYEAHTCYGEEYNGYGFSIPNPTVTDDYVNNDSDVNGCDSITTLHLIVHEPVTTMLEETLCVGEVYNQNGFHIPVMSAIDTIYTQNLQTVFGCDSVVNLHLIANPVHYIELTDDVCAGVPYNDYGFDTTFANANTYTLMNIDQNVYGCDSVTVLYLNVHPNYNINISTTICANTSYNFNGNELTVSGVYTAELSTVHGCDSIVTLTLNVGAEFRDTITDHICEGASYDKYGFTIESPETGFYDQHLTSQSGCDSFVVLHLYVHELNTTELFDTICEGNPYTLYGFNIPTPVLGSQTITRTVQTAYSCDSVVVLNLEVLPVHHFEYEDDICVNGHYSGHGFDTVITQPGTHTLIHSEENIHGCDSTVTLQLRVHPAYDQTINAAICYGETYTFDGMTLSETGTHTAEYTTDFGCDSIVTLNLTVYPEYRKDIEAHICLGESYYANGFTIDSPTETDYYTRTTQLANGCDSITYLHLFVHEPVVTELYDTLCGQGAYSGYGFIIANTTIGTNLYTRHLESAYECDSTVNLHLTVNPVHHIVVDTLLCAGEPFTKFGFDTTFAETGSYTLAYEGLNNYGCDSTFTVNIAVHPVFQHEIEAAICHNETYLFNGVALAETGNYTDTLATIYGCDSIVTLHLTVYPEKRDTLEVAICEGESYTENDFEIFSPSETKYYSHATTDVNGCDSTTVLHLIVNPRAYTNFTQTLCVGESYTENGFNVLASVPGTFTHTQHLQTTNGCDSMVTLQITVNPTHQMVFNDTACAGSAYTQHGFDTTFNEAGLYTLIHSEPNVYGCDSTITLHLRVWPSYHYSISTMICENGSYEFNGETYTEAGSYTAELQTSHGCDSIVILNLSVGAEYRDTIVAHVCEGSDYTENNFNLTNVTESGYHTQQGLAQNGCDSITVLHLIVHGLNTTELNATVCLGESYQLNGFDVTPTTAGDTTCTRIVPTEYNCDSTIVLHLTVNPTNAVALTDEVCAGIHYQANGFDTTFAEAGIYTLTNTGLNIYGCDSITTMTLTVWPNLQSEYYDTICHNTTYDFHGTILAEAGDHTVTLQSEHGCDSVVTLHLAIRPEVISEFAETACTSYTWNDSVYTTSGDYVQHFQDVNGCDSTVTLHLTIHTADAVQITATACVNFTWNDTIYTESGDYTQLFQNANGCDSLVTLHLTINPVYNINLHDTICLGTHYAANGFDTLPTDAGTYVLVHESQSIHGCDSTTTLHLTVNPTYSIDTTVNICDVEVPYIWDNEQYWETGDFDIPYSTVNGCDSIVHLHLNVNPTYSFNVSATVCQGALPYWFDEEHSFSQGGDHTITLTTVNGCDSVCHLHLTVIPNSEHYVTHTICASELPHTFMDSTFTEAGEYEIVVADIDNCLTITHFTLNVNDTYHHYDTVTVCEETLPYTYGTTSLNTTGDYDILFSTVNSCDSLVSVHFTVIPTAHGVEEQYVCASDFPMVYGGNTFTQEGTYEVVFQRDGLCDSIVTFTLHQAQEYLIPETAEVCDHSLPYEWRGMQFNESGIYYDSLTTGHGCDSVYKLTLTVNPTVVITDNPIVLCAGGSEIWRGMTLTESGTYRDTANSVTTGCYEIHEVTVTVNPTYHIYDTVTICSDELPYLWHGLTLNSAGSREDYHQTVNFCDSIYYLTLFVNPSYHATETASACDYDLPYLWHGQTITASGIYYDTLTTANGCDSTFMLTFTVNTSSYVTETETICNTSLPYLWRGYTLTAAGTYYDTVPNTFGCNDVYELQLTVNQSDVITIHDTICQGGYYTLNGFDTLAAQPGTLYDQLTLTNTNGCDSTVNLILQVMPTYLFETTASTCENVPYEWHGGSYSVEGDYYDSLTTVYGCDSVYVLHLSLNPIYDIYVTDTAIREHEYVNGSFVITPADSGTFEYDIQYFTLVGCDSIVHLTLYVAFNDGVEEFTMEPEFSFYPNPTSVMLNIRGERMKSVAVFNMAGKLLNQQDADTPDFTQIDVINLPTGHYLVKVTLDDGKTVTGKIIVSRR
ncbi:MAG: T9SS type A sorting domain-containing protein [Bacteroidales bacterium]|nr:T9SS type A sorting domain-containing protein [Bacteroidales bacterium]